MVLLSELSEGSSSSSLTHVHSLSTRSLRSPTDRHISRHRYDVFLSFRGLDTRQGFTNYLYEALAAANINTFLDDDEIETGEDLKPELERAIKESQASIVVLSKNYATSTWCLDELVLILEQRITSNHIVIPIFYHVEPTHVRKQQSGFGDAMSKHKQTMEAETDENKRSQWVQKMDRWNKALVEVANLKGKDINGRLETEFIQEVVNDIYRRLDVHLRIARPLLMGMDYFIDFITSWLQDGSSHAADIVTIVGVAGIGKTSLAKYVYELHSREFHSSSYIEDISRRCEGKFNGLLDIQKQLYCDISRKSSNQVNDISLNTLKIENAVARKRVFVVLDDIDSLDQLDALLGSKGFYPGSKIIITTKDKWLTGSCALFKNNIKPKHTELLLQGLDEIESEQLLHFHAFMCIHPKAGYKEVVEKLVKYCQGHPLALEVLGKSLHNKDVAYWEGCIEVLEKETSSRINNVLKMSFNSLSSRNDKELFKHIACFFVGTDRDVCETILQACGITTRSGITNLIDRFLLRIGKNNELKMHQLVQRMGRSEVHQESPNMPWNRSRLWCHEESFNVLKLKKGTENIVGLALDMRMLDKEKLDASFELKTDALSNMDSMMLLELNYVHMIGSYDNFPEELRCLCMHGFRLKSMPSDLLMENLVALDLSYSNIESFLSCYSSPQRLEKRAKLDGSCIKEKRLLGSLKILNLSFCKQLHSLGDFDHFPALEKLMVRGCNSLVVVCESIEHCVELVFIDLSYCKKLKKLPNNMVMLKKVITVLLDGCHLNESMDSLELSKANKNIGINTRISSSAFVGAIPSALKFFSLSLPRSLVRLSLANNNLFTESFPVDFSCLPMLKELNLDGNPIDSLPNCVRTLSRLEILSLLYCKKLKSLEYPPHTLIRLALHVVSKVVFELEMSPLRISFLSEQLYPHSYEIEGMCRIEPMVGVEENLLRSLGWTNLDLLKDRHVGNKYPRSKILMYYEFGIFSTKYEKDEMPSWFMHRSVGPSISFTIPSSANNLRGLNFCCVALERFYDASQYYLFPDSLMITFRNISKNRTWIYERYRDRDSVRGKCYVLLSHWMFGPNEMQGGDDFTITVTLPRNGLVKECGVSLLYDDGDNMNEEKDALGYYKSWNHIIGGDLSLFETTTGEYVLYNARFFDISDTLPEYHQRFVGEGARHIERKVPWGFKAFSKGNQT